MPWSRSSARGLLWGAWVLLSACGSAGQSSPEVPSQPSDGALACLSAGPETCYDATDDNCNGLIDEGCGTPTALVHIAASWREPEVDVDLEVIGPDGELVEIDRPLDNGLIKVRDCPGDDAACRGANSEHVLLQQEHALPVGTYRVRVRLEKANGAQPPIRVRLAGRLGPRSYSAELSLVSESEEAEVVWEL